MADRGILAGKAALASAAALLAVAMPAAAVTLAAGQAQPDVAAPDGMAIFTPANADHRLGALVAQRVSERGGSAQMLRFTPANLAASPDARSITVAVRLDANIAGVLAARSGPAEKPPSVTEPVRVTQTRYNLGLARGYGSFAQTPVAAAPRASAPALSPQLSRAQIPDLAEIGRPAREGSRRFAPRVALAEDRQQDVATVSGARVTDQMLDVSGSYSLTRNLDITAGVRYEQDRDLVPVPNLDQQDSQAVYVGTQFRF